MIMQGMENFIGEGSREARPVQKSSKNNALSEETPPLNKAVGRSSEKNIVGEIFRDETVGGSSKKNIVGETFRG